MIILEGCDGVGKTSTIELLKKSGICCSDRSKDVFSRYMVKEVSMKERARVYFEYLNIHDDFIIFLVNNDRDELERRINLRPIKNEFDENAYFYNQLYQDTFNYMKENDLLNNKLLLVDVTGLTLEEQVKKIKETILCQV